MQILENFNLKTKNTLGLESVAEYFAEINDLEDLAAAFDFAHKNNLAYRFLGWGANICLVSPQIKGLTLHLNHKLWKGIDTYTSKISLGAGDFLTKVVLDLAKVGGDWSPLAGFPSSVGGAVRGNAGTRQTLGDFLLKGEVYNLKTRQIEKWELADFEFAYRSSRIKTHPEYLFWQGEFHIPFNDQVLEQIKAEKEKRLNSQPQGLSAGCFFKNPPLSDLNPQGYGAGYFIDQCGLKGYQVGGAQVSPKHANFLMNVQNAQGADFARLINDIQTQVFLKFQINLELEVQIIS